MMNQKMTMATNPKINLLLVALVIASLVPLAMQVAVDAGVATHAAIRHGTDATQAQGCLKPEASFRLFHNPTTKRYGIVCNLPNVGWAVIIVDEAGKQVTSFVKEKMKSFSQVLKYMRNAGYDLVQ